MYVYYDEEGDFLEFNIGDYKKGHFRDTDEGVAEWVDEETGEVTGFAILSFRKRMQKLHEMKIKLPIKFKIVAQ